MDQNKRVHKAHVFVLRQVNHKELVFTIYLSYVLFNTCDVILDTKQKHDPYELVCFDAYHK